MGLKAPDDTVIPLCQHHHSEYHRLGVKTWEERYGSHESHLIKTGRLLAQLTVY